MNNNFNTAIILAGGKSTRMGKDKLMLKINGKSMLENIVLTLSEVFDEIIISGADETLVKIASLNTKKKLIPIHDSEIGGGPLGGILSGIEKSTSKFSYITACDMPNYNLEYIEFQKQKIINTNYKTAGCITRFKEWVEPFNGFYSNILIQDIKTHLKNGNKQIFKVINKNDFMYIDEAKAREFSPNWEMFLNLNTPEELNKYLKKDTQNHLLSCL